MAYRRRIIDRRTREGRKLGAKIASLQGFCFLIFVVICIVAAIIGKEKSSQSVQTSDETFIAPAQAALVQETVTSQTSISSARQPQANGYAPFDNTLASRPDTASMTMATNSIPLQHSPELSSARSVVSWHHVTGEGVRWNLRQVNGGSLLLVIDLGSDQVANINVAPAFENLELTAMNLRVDSVRSIIVRSFPFRTANYSYERDGSIRQLP